MIIKISAPVWMYDGPSPWHFATIDRKTSTKIKDLKLPKRGWGSVKVIATIGNTKWKTSIFPDKDGTYLLPLKKSVRVSENIKASGKINLNLEIIDDSLEE